MCAGPVSSWRLAEPDPPKHVRFGSLADIGQSIRDVRFAPKADMCSVKIDVCFVPIADLPAGLLRPGNHAKKRFAVRRATDLP